MKKVRFVWTDEKIQYLIEHWNKKVLHKLAAELRANSETISKKAKELELPEYKSNRWNEKEVAKLRELAPTTFYKEIAKILGKSELSILKKSTKLGIKVIYARDVNSATFWTEEKEKYLLENYDKIGITELGKTIDVPYHQILKKLKEFGIEWENRKWKEEEIQTLIEMAPTCHYTEIAKVLDRTTGSIAYKAFDLGIEVISDYRKFTDQEKYFTIENWDSMSGAEIARNLKCSIGQLYRLKKELNLPNKGQNIKWTTEKIALLRKLAKTKTVSQLAKRFKSTNTAIISTASKNGIELIDSKKNWHEDEIVQLKELAQTMTVDQIVQIMKKPSYSIRLQAKRFNIELINNKTVHTTKRWTKEQISQLEELLPNYTTIEIAEIMDKTEDAIYVKAKKLGLQVLGVRKRWTIEEEEMLINMWGNYSIELMAKRLGRTSSAITNRAFVLKLGSVMVNNYDGLTIQEIADLFAVNRMTVGVNWVSLGLVFTKKRISAGKSYLFVTIDDLYIFLEKYQNIWDSRMLEPNILPPEPEWLTEKRKKDKLLPILIPKTESLTKEQLIAARKYYLELAEQEDNDLTINDDSIPQNKLVKKQPKNIQESF